MGSYATGVDPTTISPMAQSLSQQWDVCMSPRIRGVTVNRRPFLLPGVPSKSYIDLSIVDFDGWRSVYHVARWGRSVISALPSSSLLRVDGEQRAPRWRPVQCDSGL